MIGFPQASDSDRIALGALLGSALFSGGSAVATRVSNRELAPLWNAGLRFALAGALLALAVAALRLELPRGRAAVGSLLYGGLHFGAAMALAYWGFVEVPAGLGQTLIAVMPLAALLLAVLQGQERLRAAAVAGALLALAGVASLSRASVADGVPPLSLLAMLGSALCLAQAAVLVRRYPRMHPVTLNAVAMIVGAVLLIAGSLVAGETIAAPHGTGTWISLVYMVAFGSVVGFVLYAVVLGRWAASRASYQFVLSPFVAVTLSAWIDDEQLHAGLLLGGLLVIAGVYVGALREGAPAP